MKGFQLEQIIQDQLDLMWDEFDGTEKEFQKKIDSISDELIQTMALSAGKVLTEFSLEQVNGSRERSGELEEKIDQATNGSIETFEVFLELNKHIGGEVYRTYHEHFDEYDDLLKLDILTEIHSRGCQIAGEILLLIRSGFADGAMARWRSLHELCAVFMFLYEADTEVVRMFNDYEVIDSYKKAEALNASHAKLGWERISRKEMKELKRQKDNLKKKYGAGFLKEYGWTMKVLPEKERNFWGIEKAVGLDKYRVFYRWSSESIHCGVSGNRKRLSVPEDGKNAFIHSASEHGLDDPFQLTSVSLMDMTDRLLCLEDSLLFGVYGILLEELQNSFVLQLFGKEKPD